MDEQGYKDVMKEINESFGEGFRAEILSQTLELVSKSRLRPLTNEEREQTLKLRNLLDELQGDSI